jgi:hypothetical protein
MLVQKNGIELRVRKRGRSRLAKESCGNVAHVLLLEFVVFAVVLVNTSEFEGGDHGWNVEAHGGEAVYQRLVVSVIPVARVSKVYFCGQGDAGQHTERLWQLLPFPVSGRPWS